MVQAVCYWPFTAGVWVRFQAFYVRYVVDEVALGQVLSEYVYTFNYSFIGHLIVSTGNAIQGVSGGFCHTSGECSLG